MGLMQKWNDFTPTKGMVGWAAVGACVLTVAVGFSVGGWVTGSTAQKMADDAAAASHAELAAVICVDRFSQSETARAQYQELVELSSFRQRQYVEEAEWSHLPGGEALDRQSATLCANQIAELDPDELPNPVAATSETMTDSAVQ